MYQLSWTMSKERKDIQVYCLLFMSINTHKSLSFCFYFLSRRCSRFLLDNGLYVSKNIYHNDSWLWIFVGGSSIITIIIIDVTLHPWYHNMKQQSTREIIFITAVCCWIIKEILCFSNVKYFFNTWKVWKVWLSYAIFNTM